MSTQEPDHFHQLASLFAGPVQHDREVTSAASPPRWRAGACRRQSTLADAGLEQSESLCKDWAA